MKTHFEAPCAEITQPSGDLIIAVAEAAQLPLACVVCGQPANPFFCATNALVRNGHVRGVVCIPLCTYDEEGRLAHHPEDVAAATEQLLSTWVDADAL